MRLVGAIGQEEWPFVLTLELRDDAISNPGVGRRAVGSRWPPRCPHACWRSLLSLSRLLFRGFRLSCGREILVPGILIARPAMEDLPASLDGIAILAKGLRQCDGIRQLVAKCLEIAVDTRVRRHDPREQADSRRIAQRRCGVGTRKGHPPNGKTVDVRSQGARVAVEMTHPVIQVVDRDEQDVWPGRCFLCLRDSEVEQRGEEQEAWNRVHAVFAPTSPWSTAYSSLFWPASAKVTRRNAFSMPSHSTTCV